MSTPDITKCKHLCSIKYVHLINAENYSNALVSRRRMMPDVFCQTKSEDAMGNMELTVYNLGNTLRSYVHGQISMVGGFINVINTCKSFDFSAACLCVNTPAICLLAVFQRGGHMNQEEISSSTAVLQNGLTCCLS